MPLLRSSGAVATVRSDTKNPIYRNHVLTIEYGPGIIADPISRRFWFDNIKEFLRPEDYDEPEDYDGPFFDIKVEQAYQTHCRYYDDQKRMRATGYDFEVLQSAVSRLPNLRGVRITCNYGEHLNKFVHPPPAWGDAFCNMAKVMASPNDFISGRHRNFTREITVCLAAFKLASRPLSWLDCANFEIDALRYDENEASDGDESEDESEGDYIGITVRPSRFKNFIRDPTEDLGPPLVCATFKNLTAVRLNFPAIGGPESEFLQEKLGTALRGAHGLDTLCIGEDFTDQT
ncbi:hypothetical protein V491_09001, partial [Pseudogymnoascus sp. VKM F-3775]